MVLLIYCIILIIVGYYLNGKSFKGFEEIFKHPGRVVTDLIKHVGFGLTLVNMGVVGIMSIVYVKCMGGHFNALILSATLSVIGFGAFGKHLKNCFPLLIGGSLVYFILARQVDPSIIIMSTLLATGLAPIAGEFGVLIGVGVGVLHLFLVVNLSSFHGGLMLYNNGFSTGIIATLFIPMLDAFRRGEK